MSRRPDGHIKELAALPAASLLARLCDLTPAERRELRAAPKNDDSVSTENWYLIRMATAPAAELRWPRDDVEWRLARSRDTAHLHGLARSEIQRMAQFGPGDPWFAEIRRYERDGTLDLPADDEYVLAMISGLGSRWPDAPAKTNLLRDDPELVERAFWRIFEVDSDGEMSLTNVDKFSATGTTTWLETVVELAGDGTIDRARVLDATLDALARGFTAYRAGWFSRLHNALKPTVDEQAPRQDRYAILLRSTIGPTVSLAVNALTSVHRAGRLDDALVAPGLTAAASATAKSTAAKAIRLAAAAGAPLDALAAGLSHPHAEVQAAAVAELRKLGGPALDLVRAAARDLAPSVAEQVAGWLESAPGTAAASPTSATPVSEAPVPGTPVPQPVTPIAGPDELAEALAELLAHPHDAELGERCLAAAYRFGADPVGAGSLRSRAHRHIEEEDGGLRSLAARLALAVAGETPPPVKPHSVRPLGIPIAGRLVEVADAVAAGRRGTLLAAPTHTGGWIEPATLIDRARAGTGLSDVDMVSAVLRLGPLPADPAVLAAAAEVPDPLGDPIRYALGGLEPSEPVDAPLWIVAARARTPYLDDPELIAAGLDDVGAGRAVRWRVGRGIGDTRPILERQPPGAPRYAAEPLFPTCALADHAGRVVYDPPASWLPWIALMWPGNPEPALILGLRGLLYTVERRVSPTALPALELLTTTAADLPASAPFVLAAGLGAAFTAERVAAVDAAAVLLPHRITPVSLASAMAEMIRFVPVNRWSAALTELALAGRGEQVRAVLAALLPIVDVKQRGLHALVAVLRDEHLRSRVPVTDPGLRDWLAARTGGSALAKAARELALAR